MGENELVRPGLCHHLAKEIPSIKEKLSSKVTKATYRQVRRSKIPLYKAILQELDEDGFPLTKQFLEGVIHIELNLMKDAEGLKKRKFSDFPIYFEEFVEILKEFECKIPNAKLIEKLTNLAELIESDLLDLKWIVEYIFLKALDESRKILDDNGELAARCLLLLGRTYAKKNNYDLAVNKLMEGRSLSKNKSWTVSDTDFALLNKIICAELSHALLSLANESTNLKDEEQTLILTDKALKFAEESNQSLALGNAYRSVGEILVKFQNFTDAKNMFNKALIHYRIEGNFEYICKTEINVVKSCLKLSEFENCKKHIEKAIKIATTNELTHELANAHAANGDIHRMIGETNNACDCYFKSVELYHALGNESKMRKVRCLAAVAMAQDVINPYIDTVLKSDAEEFGDNRYMEMLLKWSDCREHFWNERNDKETVDYSKNSVETISDDGILNDTNSYDDDQLKKFEKKKNVYPSDLSMMNLLLNNANSNREESYSIFQRFRSEAISKMTQSSYNYTKI